MHWTQRRLLWLLLATYLVGALAPAAGVAMRGVRLAGRPVLGTAPTLPLAMLGLLLVVAGLGARFEQVRHIARRPWLLLGGLVANAVYPIAFTTIAAAALLCWHNTDEAQSILVGLALIGAMPIAGSSTAWSQNADGNLALSLGLVWASTLASPLLTPLGLHAIGLLTHGDYSEDLHELASQGSVGFVVLAVVAPSLVGVLLRLSLGAARVGRVMPALKLLNLVNLLLLNYSNAAVALPQAVARPDWDFLVVVAGTTAAMCAGAFAVGWWLPRRLHAERDEQTAFMFALGMNNNGTGLVLAGAALSDHPLVLLPIIFYNLVQQSAAGLVDWLRRREPARASRQ